MSDTSHASPVSATNALLTHVRTLQYTDLDSATRIAAKTFILDTLGVGVSGSAAAFASELAAGLQQWRGEAEASILGTSKRTSAGTAAVLNGFHAHCQEFDCVHEGAVVHPLATIQPATLAFCERAGNISGEEYLTAVVAGVDVSTTIGVASNETLRFFRPATAGIFGSTAALARLAKLNEQQTSAAMGLALAQCAGTMQAHDEGLSTLAVQIGLAARAAIQAVDLAKAGVPGPQHWLEGPHGYLPLFEGRWDIDPRIEEIKHRHRITEVSHKPFPAGRATHAGVDGVLQLRGAGVDADSVERIEIFVPPLIEKLVGRPVNDSMGVNYARLCLQYVAAMALRNGTVRVTDYQPERLADATTLALANRVRIHVDDNPDPNALGPQRIVAHLNNGETREVTIIHTLGSPDNPLTQAQHLAKFRQNWTDAPSGLDVERGERVIDCVDTLESLTDIRALTELFHVTES